MRYKINDILKEKGTKTNCFFKVLDVNHDYYYCEQGFLKRDSFIGEARYVIIPFKNEGNFHIINDYLEDIEVKNTKEDSQTFFLGRHQFQHCVLCRKQLFGLQWNGAIYRTLGSVLRLDKFANYIFSRCFA